MRIGIDVRALMEGRTTGVQVYITNLLNTLFAQDRDNEYVLFANSFKKINLPEFDYPNVQYLVTRYPNKLFNFFQKFFNWPKVDKICKGLDLFFSPHWRVVALDKKVPLVVTFHDLSYEVIPEFFTLRQRLWHRLMNYRKAALQADKVIAVSDSTKQDLVDIYQIPEKSIEVIYSGVDLRDKSGPASPGQGGGSLDLPEKYFLFLATFEPRKNLDNLLEAYREYRKKSQEKIPLVMAGSSGWKSDIDFAGEMKSHVIICKNISEREKVELYKGAFVFLFLSFYEGFGFPILEAASRGVPVISSFATSLQEVGREFALFVNPFRPNQVARAMLSLEEDNQLYQELRSGAASTAKKFKWEDTAKKTLELFKNVYDR